MRMVPRSPYETGSQAEKRIFEGLRSAFDARFAAYHSLRPTRHPRKRFPEIDFVVCGPDGLYVLEVKGGRVACRDGVWRYEDRYGRTVESQEGPLRQAESALHGLLADLRANLSDEILERLTVGYGAVFPDCGFAHDGAEWDQALVADARACRDLESWLGRLFAFWRRRHGRVPGPDAVALRTLQEYLRPDLDSPAREAEDRLLGRVEDARRRIDRFTDDQMRMADVAEANPRVLCAGWRGHREDVSRRAPGPEVGRRRRNGRPGLPVSLAQALPRLAARGARAHRVADRRRCSRLPPRGSHAFRRADRRRGAGPVRNAMSRDAGRCRGRRARGGSVVLVPRPQQPVVEPPCRVGGEGAPGVSGPGADAVADQLPQHPGSSSNGFRRRSAPISVSAEPDPDPPCAAEPRRTGGPPPRWPRANSKSWWTWAASRPAR